MYTLQDSRKEKQAQDDVLMSKMDAVANNDKAISKILMDNPQIGVITRNSVPMYYTFTPSYREASHPQDLV